MIITITQNYWQPPVDVLDAVKITGITATRDIDLTPGASYNVDLSGTNNGSTVTLQRIHADGTTVSNYDDSSGWPQAFGIDVTYSGKVRLVITGGTSPSITAAFKRQLSKLG